MYVQVLTVSRFDKVSDVCSCLLSSSLLLLFLCSFLFLSQSSPSLSVMALLESETNLDTPWRQHVCPLKIERCTMGSPLNTMNTRSYTDARCTEHFMIYGNTITTPQVITISRKLYPCQYNNVIMGR